ncbi:methyl-accepting chemotaxis protein [Nocardioides pacificus]
MSPQSSALQHIGLRGRLVGVIVLIALTTVAVGAFGIQRMSTISDKADQVYTEGAVPLDGLRQLQADWWELSAYTARAAITTLPPESIERAQKDSAATLGEMQEHTEQVRAMKLSGDTSAAFDEFATSTERYLGLLGQLQTLGLESDPAEANRILTEMNEAELAIASSLVDATAAAEVTATTTADEANAAYTSARTWTIAIILVALATSIAAALLLVRSIIGPVRRVNAVLDQVAGGDLSVRVGTTGGAEIGEVAASVDRTLDSLSAVLTLVGSSATRLGEASEQLTGVADGIADNARTAAGQAEMVVGSAGEVAHSVDTVASGSEQMDAAIREIAVNVTEVARVAGQAVGVAEETTRMVGKLGDSSQEIAAVVKLINGIAEQTNLLALNATIEAARAGEAGKGFAVVASEVKELAQETARATEDISSRVAAIQSDTAGAVEAIGHISGVIGEINDYQSTIAAAVEEQTSTTNEMNRNVSEAAHGSRQIAESISGLAAGTQQTTERAADAQTAAIELARMSGELQEAVGRFTL